MELTMWYCPGCRGDRPFERPHENGSCAGAGDDGPGECPELACTECGFALMIAFTPAPSAHGTAARGFPGQEVAARPGPVPAGTGLEGERGSRRGRAA